MARKKTRKQKVKASLRRKAPARESKPAGSEVSLDGYDLQEESLRGGNPSVRRRLPDSELYSYDPKFLSGDIRKTVVLSGVVLAVEVLVFLVLR